MQWWPATTECNPWWAISLLYPGTLPLGVIHILRPTYAKTSSPKSVWTPSGVRPQSLLAFIQSPPSSCLRLVIPSVPPPYREPLVPSLLSQSTPFPTPPNNSVLAEVLLLVCPVAVVERDCAAQVQEGHGRFQGICVYTDSHPTGFKECCRVSQRLRHPPKTELVWFIVPITEAQWWDLDPAPLTFGKRGGILFQDTQAISPLQKTALGR